MNDTVQTTVLLLPHPTILQYTLCRPLSSTSTECARMTPRHVTIFFLSLVVVVSLAVRRAPRGPTKTRQALRPLRNICCTSPPPKGLAQGNPITHQQKYRVWKGVVSCFFMYYAALAMALRYTAYSRGNKISLSQPPTKKVFLYSLSAPRSTPAPQLHSISGIVSLPSLSSTATKGETNHECQTVIGQTKRHLTQVDRCPCPSDISTRSGLDTTVAFTCQYK